MIEWLVPVSLFWTFAALYLGGFKIEIDDGPGLRNIGGLLLTFVLFLAIWWAVRTGLGAVVGPMFAVVIGVLVAMVALPFASRAAFRVFGLKIRPAPHAH